MSAHILLNLFNELRKRDKMRGLPSILALFRNEFYKFNSKIARIPCDIKITLNLISAAKHFNFVIMYALCVIMQRCYGRHKVSQKSVKH